MTPLTIIIHFHVLKDTQPRLQPRTVPLPMNQLRLERTKERLHISIVIAIATSAHTRDHAVFSQKLLISIARILPACMSSDLFGHFCLKLVCTLMLVWVLVFRAKIIVLPAFQGQSFLLLS